MFLDNVFTGFTKDGKDRCLQKKYKTLYTDNGDVSRSVYIDLETKEIFEKQDVDEATLMPITNLITFKNWEWKRRVVSVYKADRETLINVKGAFYGNIVEVDRSKWHQNNPNCENILIEKALVANVNDKYGKVMDLNSSLLYRKLINDKDFLLWGRAVREVSPIDNSQFDEEMQPKRKLLEMHYKKEL